MAAGYILQGALDRLASNLNEPSESLTSIQKLPFRRLQFWSSGPIQFALMTAVETTSQVTSISDVGYARPHLLGIDGLSPIEITSLLDLADAYVDQNRMVNKKSGILRGRTLINLFFEPSTRTQSSLNSPAKGWAPM